MISCARAGKRGGHPSPVPPPSPRGVRGYTNVGPCVETRFVCTCHEEAGGLPAAFNRRKALPAPHLERPREIGPNERQFLRRLKTAFLLSNGRPISKCRAYSSIERTIAINKPRTPANIAQATSVCFLLLQDSPICDRSGEPKNRANLGT